MNLFKYYFLFFLLFSMVAFAQPANDNCANATNLTVNAPCIAGTTYLGTTQGGEVSSPSCSGGFTQTVWYTFTATATHMYVQLSRTTFSGSGATWGPGYWTSVVYNSSTCQPSSGQIISCQTSNSQGTADGVIVNEMFGLTVGSTYLIQIGYRTGGGVNLVPNYCIIVSDVFTPDCNTCANPCGAACGFTSVPTVAQVTANCPSYPQMQYNEGAVADTQCYTFNAINDTADFQVIVNSTCGGGNVSNFSWTLYQFGNCGGGPIQSGTLSSLKFTGLTIGAGYVFCFSFTVPAGCYHTAYWPYFIGATPLPVELLYFTGERDQDKVNLRWTTASEINNDYFIVQHSSDGKNYSQLGIVGGAGNSSTQLNYDFIDEDPSNGINYYRLLQVDYDGHTTEYPAVSMRFDKKYSSIFPNPVNEFTQLGYYSDADKTIHVKIFDALGKLMNTQEIHVLKGNNSIAPNLSTLMKGIYHLQIEDNGVVDHLRFTRQ